MTQIAITLDHDTLAILDESAAFRSLSREDMLRKSIREAADCDRYYRQSIERGLRDMEEGRVISNEQMKADISALFQRIQSAGTEV